MAPMSPTEQMDQRAPVVGGRLGVRVPGDELVEQFGELAPVGGQLGGSI